jgi:phospholipid/cholesterol/gamma-HCH transport system substrate-binding protein
MNKRTNYLKLGLFVTLGTILLVIALYLLGSKRNLFSSNFTLYATFRSIDGLTKGNVVRLSGINIGTVESVEIIDDTTVVVEMVILTSSQKFIRKNSVADIGSDGLMGNKLVNLQTRISDVPLVTEGDTLHSKKVVATDDMMRTLDVSNNNIAAITTDLRRLSREMVEGESAWKLLKDTTALNNIRRSLQHLEQTTKNASDFTAQLEELTAGIKSGKGLAGKLINDPASEQQLTHALNNLQIASDSARKAISQLQEFTEALNNQTGITGTLTADTAAANNLKETLENVNEGSVLLNENLKAMRENWLFRKYFKEQEKK